MSTLAEDQDLEARARAGDAKAQALLGRRLLLQIPADWDQGIALTAAAAKAGISEAAHLLAVIAAMGRIAPPDWSSALLHLQRAAEQGYKPAQAQLAMLAPQTEVAKRLRKGKVPERDDWWRLQNAFNLRAWLQTPPAQALCEAPRVFRAEKFIPPEFCNWYVKQAKPRLERATVVDPATGQSADDPDRNNALAYFNMGDADLILLLLHARIATLTGVSVSGMEAAAVLHYTAGERFLPHHDFLSPEIPGHAEALAQGGQRILTFLVYLNDNYQGGETEFLVPGIRHKGRKGDALFFWNAGPDGLGDPATLHAGLSPTRGEKWLLSQWVRSG